MRDTWAREQCLVSRVAPRIPALVRVPRGVTRPQGQVVPQQLQSKYFCTNREIFFRDGNKNILRREPHLHDQGTVFVAIFIESVQLCYSVVKCLANGIFINFLHTKLQRCGTVARWIVDIGNKCKCNINICLCGGPGYR